MILNVNLSNPRVMSMKKKMMAQKKEKGMEAIASLNGINCKNLIFHMSDYNSIYKSCHL